MPIADIEKCIETLVGDELPSHINAYEFIESVLGLVSGEEEEEQGELPPTSTTPSQTAVGVGSSAIASTTHLAGVPPRASFVNAETGTQPPQ